MQLSLSRLSRLSSPLVIAAALAACANGVDQASVSSDLVPAEDRCDDPVALSGTPDADAPGYLVIFREGTDGQAETARLAEAYGFDPTDIFAALGGYSVEVLSDDARESLRCEPSVSSIGYNGFVERDGSIVTKRDVVWTLDKAPVVTKREIVWSLDEEPVITKRDMVWTLK